MINIDDLIWVELDREEDFLIVKETLTRIGVASKSNKTLYQSCHILHKRGRYAIVHFRNYSFWTVRTRISAKKILAVETLLSIS